MSHVHYDADAIIEQFRVAIEANHNDAAARATKGRNKQFVEAQYRLELARLHLEKTAIELINEGMPLHLVLSACGAIAGGFVAAKLNTATASGSEQAAKQVLVYFEMALEDSLTSQPGYDENKNAVFRSVVVEPVKAGRA